MCNPKSKDIDHWAKCPVKSEANACPIVAVKMISKEQADEIKEDPISEWKVSSYEDTENKDKSWYLAYSTTDSEENPLSDVKASDIEICLDPGKNDHSARSTSVYALE